MMLYLRDLLLYGLVALHLVGGAALFRRLCPRESPWLAFIIPALAIAMVCNCIEHGIALTGLRWLLPVTTIGSVGLLISPKTNWRFLWKPSLVFLLSFAIPFVLRCYKPDIAQARDGIFDLCFITNFCMGDTLPPESTWMPGFKVRYYYDFTHYAASVGLRFFGLDPGTGFNVMSALLAGLILFCTAAVAYHVSRRRLWVSLLIVLMTATAMTGITDDLWLFHPDNRWPDDATNLFNRTGDATTGSPYESFLPRGKDYWCTRELIPSGYWCWMNSYHSVMGGQFLMLFALLCLVEMCNPRRTNWPWIGALWAILLPAGLLDLGACPSPRRTFSSAPSCARGAKFIRATGDSSPCWSPRAAPASSPCSPTSCASTRRRITCLRRAPRRCWNFSCNGGRCTFRGCCSFSGGNTPIPSCAFSRFCCRFFC